jgi:hypothetical protein
LCACVDRDIDLTIIRHYDTSLMISNAEMTFNPKATEEPGWTREAEIERVSRSATYP